MTAGWWQGGGEVRSSRTFASAAITPRARASSPPTTRSATRCRFAARRTCTSPSLTDFILATGGSARKTTCRHRGTVRHRRRWGACRPALPDGRAGGGVRVRGGAGHPAGLGVGSRWYPRFRAAVCGVFGHGPGAAGFVQAVLGAGASGLPTPGGRERGSGSAGLRVRGADRSGGGRPRAAPGGGIDGRRATGRRRRLAGGLSALAEVASG